MTCEAKLGTCSECGSDFKCEASGMVSLCPECAHYLYGYDNCAHVFENGICQICLWNGSVSDYVKRLKDG